METRHETASAPELARARDEGLTLETAIHHLAVDCGFEPDSGTIRRAVRAELGRDSDPDLDPLERLRRIVRTCGMRAEFVRINVRDAVHHARDEHPLAVSISEGGRDCYLSLVRRSGGRVRVRGLESGDITVGLRGLASLLGETADTPRTWLAVQRDLPAQDLALQAPPPGGEGPPQDPDDESHGGSDHGHPTPFQRIRALAKLERVDLWCLLGYSVVTGLLYLAVPLAADALVSNIAFGGQQRVYVQALLVLAGVLAAFLCLHALVRALAFTVIERLQRRLFVRFTADFALRLPRVCQTEFDRHHGPELTNRFFDIMTLQKAAAQLLLDGLDVLLTFLVGSVVLAFYDWTLFWFDAGMLVLVFLVIWRLGRGGIQSSIAESRAKYATAGWLQQVALFSTVFKAPGGKELAAEWADGFTRRYLRERQAHFRILFQQVLGLLGVEVAAAVVLLGWGGFLVLEGHLSVGQLVASQLILTATLAAVAKFGKQLETAYDCLTAIDKVGHLVDLKVESDTGESPRPGSPQGADVVVENLSFEYSHGSPVINGLNLRLEPGARVAWVAESSSGSTTMLDILYGLREPSAGHVDLDGLDLRHWKRSELRRHVARVHGDDEIFDGSLFDNVRLGNEAVGLAEVREAMAAVGLLRKVQAMKLGLREPISILGRSLSGTERRQVLLARAMVAQPRLLLLDATLDGFEPEVIEKILTYLCAPSPPWTLMVVTRDPDVIQRFPRRITLRSTPGSASASHGN